MVANVDVLVVGAGPTGLTMAAELARHGVECRLIDRLPGPQGIAKASGIMPRTLEVLDDMGVGPAFREAGLAVESMVTYAGEEEPLFDLRFTAIDSPHAHVLCLPQSETERLLGELLARRGGRIERGVELVQLEEFDDFIRAELLEDGRRTTVHARYLVGCDGAHSFVRHALGFTFPGGLSPQDFALGHVRIDWDVPRDRIVTFLVDQGCLFATPLPDGRWLMVADLVGAQQEMHAGKAPTVADLQRLVDERVRGGGRVSEPQWTTFFRVHHRQVERYGRERAFLAGDAAHIHSPFGGQGMNTGIQDAYNLAWKLGLVLRRGGRPALLDSYDRERRPVGKAVLNLSTQLQATSSFRNPVLQGVRDLAMRCMGHLEVVSHHVAAQLGEVLYSYRGGPLAAEHHEHGVRLHPDPRHPGLRDCRAFGAGPRAGDRAPDPVIEGGRLARHLGGARFSVLLFEGSHAAAGEADDLRALAGRLGGSLPLPVEAFVVDPRAAAGAADTPGVLSDPEQEAHHAYGARGQCLYLIRPDGYVAYRSQPIDVERLAGFVGQHLIG